MLAPILDLIRAGAALAVGAVIGLAFGALQQAARRRNEQLEKQGKFKNGWSLMPGAGTRVAYLLIALVIIQVVCPMLFADNTQWWVSGGLGLGYGWCLWEQLRRRRAGLQ
jgi:hypothetical protein